MQFSCIHTGTVCGLCKLWAEVAVKIFWSSMRIFPSEILCVFQFYKRFFSQPLKIYIIFTVSGAVFAWGHNGDGQLGTGDLQDSLSPHQVLKLDAPAVGVAAGSSHSLVLTGRVYINFSVYVCRKILYILSSNNTVCTFLTCVHVF